MNEKVFVLTVFFITLFVIGQIRFLIRLRKLRRCYGNLSGIHLILEGMAFPCCCEMMECCAYSAACCTKTTLDSDTAQYESSRYEERDSSEKIVTKDEKISEKYRISEEQKQVNKIKVLVHGMETISIETACKITKLSKKRIIEIIAADPDYYIEDNNIINLKAISDEKLRKELTLQAQGICGNCGNMFEPNTKFCPNCGQALK